MSYIKFLKFSLQILVLGIHVIGMGILYYKKNDILKEIKNPNSKKEKILLQTISNLKQESLLYSDYLNFNNKIKIFYHVIEKNKIRLEPKIIDLNNQNSFINPLYFQNPNQKLHVDIINQIIPIIIDNLKKSKKPFYTSIPKGTYLLSHKIKKNTLHLNFNENFLNNSFGEIGKKIKIAQILKSFSQIKKIQFIEFNIENKTPKYLDRDGLIKNKKFSISLIKDFWNV